MWNYSYTIPTLFIYTILFIYFIVGASLPVRRNRNFLLLVASEGLTIILDLYATYLDNNYALYPRNLLLIVNLLFFMSFVARIYFFVNYILSVPEQDVWIIRIGLFTQVFFVIFEAIVFMSVWTKWIFYIDENGYHSGRYYSFTTFVMFAFILEMLILIYLFKNRFSKREFLSGLLFVALLFAGVIARMHMPYVLVLNTFCLGALLVIFLTFQDIHLYEDQRVGLFNNRAFHQYIIEHINKRRLYIFGYGIINYNELRKMFGGAQMDTELRDITAYLKRKYPGKVLFYLRNGRFMVASDRPFEHYEIKTGMVALGTVEFPYDLQIDSGNQLFEVAKDVFSKFEGELGNRHIVVDHEHLVEINHNIRVQQALNYAIKNDSIQVYLQPIYSVERKRITGAEALARIDDPEMGMIQPYDFISVAEKNGLIVKVGDAVFRKTCKFLKENTDARLQWININLSPIQCVAEEPITELMDICDEYGISGERLKLEITEDAMVDETDLRNMMIKLSDHGFCFELDDFGVGFSNVLRLSNFPFTAVKIDRELVWQYHDNPTNSMLPHLIEDIRNAGMDVVAEGIESKSMGREMIDLGCNYLQGFYFSRPVPMKRFTKVFDLKWEEFR